MDNYYWRPNPFFHPSIRFIRRKNRRRKTNAKQTKTFKNTPINYGSKISHLVQLCSKNLLLLFLARNKPLSKIQLFMKILKNISYYDKNYSFKNCVKTRKLSPVLIMFNK